VIFLCTKGIGVPFQLLAGLFVAWVFLRHCALVKISVHSLEENSLC
jgi:hypothetical protein